MELSDEAVEKAARAMYNPEMTPEEARDEARQVLLAALPVIERDLREKIASEVEALRTTWPGAAVRAFDTAAARVREGGCVVSDWTPPERITLHFCPNCGDSRPFSFGCLCGPHHPVPVEYVPESVWRNQQGNPGSGRRPDTKKDSMTEPTYETCPECERGKIGICPAHPAGRSDTDETKR